MKVLNLLPAGNNEKPIVDIFVREMQNTHEVEERVYRIAVEIDGKPHIITTTAKDVALRIAGYSNDGKAALVQMINEEFTDNAALTELLITSEDNERPLYVMRIVDQKKVIIPIQPAYK